MVVAYVFECCCCESRNKVIFQLLPGSLVCVGFDEREGGKSPNGAPSVPNWPPVAWPIQSLLFCQPPELWPPQHTHTHTHTHGHTRTHTDTHRHRHTDAQTHTAEHRQTHVGTDPFRVNQKPSERDVFMCTSSVGRTWLGHFHVAGEEIILTFSVSLAPATADSLCQLFY